MNEIERQILESLQCLLSMQNPKSEQYQKNIEETMVRNHLLLNPIKEESIKDKTKEVFKE